MPQPGYPPYPVGGTVPPYPPAGGNTAPYPMTNTMPYPPAAHGPLDNINPPSYDQVLSAEQYQKQAPYNPGYNQ